MVITSGGCLLFKAGKHRHTETGCSCGHEYHHTDRAINNHTASITGFIAGLILCPTVIAPLIISRMHNGFSSPLLHVLIYVIGMTLVLFIFTHLPCDLSNEGNGSRNQFY